jgi:SAM-dependent methyltransferase
MRNPSLYSAAVRVVSHLRPPLRLARGPSRRRSPPRGWVRFGSLRRVSPVSRDFGWDRGTPVDRYYIERFLERHAAPRADGARDIRGHVLEIGEDRYTRQFGRLGEAGLGVDRVEVLDLDEGNPSATIVADLTSADHVPSRTFDCVICTQTLHLIYDVRAAIRAIHRLLKPGGVLLATVPGISQICPSDDELWDDYWRFTTRSARRITEEAFPARNVSVEAFGNVLTATAFLQGIVTEELDREELDARDPEYEVVVAIRAVKDACGRD